MKTQKYKLKSKTRIGGEWKEPGTVVELTPDQIERLEQAEQQKTNKQEAE